MKIPLEIPKITSYQPPISMVKANTKIPSRKIWATKLNTLITVYFLGIMILDVARAQEDSGNQSNQTEHHTEHHVPQKEIDSIMKHVPDEGENVFDEKEKEEDIRKYSGGKLHITVDSIEPEGGPTTGQTRVLVRGGPFKGLEALYPHPKCKFGKQDQIVQAVYVNCSTRPTAIEENEPRHRNRNDTCLQCENTVGQEEAEIVPFTVSLTGDFSDVQNNVPYRYYKPVRLFPFNLQTRVWAIYPRYGPKDGETFVQVWGENFLNFDENTRCNFGSKSVVAHYVSSNYMTCISPFSDVVEKAIPFSVSLNKQQNSRDNIDFWYYNWPQVTELVPNYGPDSGGNKVLVKGNNFMPFIENDNIDNQNDTFCEFEGIGKVPAEVINSTKVYCVAPPNYVLDETVVEVTLNNQQYTDDNVPYYYYRPPQTFDVDPREGPTKGGTTVIVYGNKFKSSKNITCKFGEKLTKGTYVDSNKIKCVSPQVERPGYVPLTISYEGERYSSETVKYLYYENPEIYNITPTCGPVTGYTQITVKGKNFIDMGFGKVKCIFNESIMMNATIMEEDIIKCDSPPLPPSFGYASDGGAPFYFVSVTLNGREWADTNIKFIYYIDPQIHSVLPGIGPVRGGTVSQLIGQGFNQEGVCNMTVRYGAIQQKILNFTDTDMNITSPPSKVPVSVVVSVAPNGQQFVNDITLHYRDIENTFTYYQDIYIQDYSPKAGPTSGGTKIVVKGMGFNQFKFENGSHSSTPIWVRFIDAANNQTLAEETPAFDQTDERFSWKTPPAPLDTKAIMQVSYNRKDWQDVIPPDQKHSYSYYNAPQITKITPAYGPVKSPNDETIELIGKNFQCPDPECRDLFVRFGDPDKGNAIYVKGEREGDDKVKVKVPKYTKPDVLPVEVTFNDQDYTHDNQTYGFFDPFVLDVQPRLINVKGTSRVRLYGFGFVNSSDSGNLRSKYGSVDQGDLNCGGNRCILPATYIDKTTLETGTFPQSQVNYKNGQNIQFDGMAVEASVQGEAFTENNIEVFYYDEPIYQSLSDNGSPENMKKPIFVKTDFKWQTNDPEKFKRHGNFSCRFSSPDGRKVVYTKARMETFPLGSNDEKALPTHMRCVTPKWDKPETARLDLSVNGQEYSGDFPFTFYDILDLYRIVPLAGPNEGKTKVKLYGSGFLSTKEDVQIKWGVLDTEKMQKETVSDFIWNENQFIQKAMVEGSEVLRAYKKEAFHIAKKDYELHSGDKLKTYVANAPKLPNWNATHGGPVYLSVGEHMILNITNYTMSTLAVDESGPQNHSASYFQKTIYKYSYSFVEYYYYQNPVVKKVEPYSGLTRGGTPLEISGAWFKLMPEYGIVPHCKIGPKVVRARFYSTVRIVCNSPPNDDINSLYQVQVSLNGVDFVDTGYTFHYFEQPILYSMSPTMGPESGGTQIYITGAKFSNISDPQNFNCKFTSLNQDMPPKTIPAFYQNQTTIMCSSPGGWGRGDSVRVQVTFNGADYSDNNFTFDFYNIQRAFPKSGPADGSGGPILIQGSGFKNGTDIFCQLDKTLYEPLEVEPDQIKCPMVPAKGGPTSFSNVDFSVVIDGNWHKFPGGFQYYEQIELDDMYPHTGPSEGHGVIYFYGRNFREDYPNAEVGCHVGDSVGKGKVLNSGTIRCVVDEMALVDEGQQHTASVALNSYSWADSNQTFVPYGITGLYPNSGPYQGNTDILITGKGFNEDMEDKAKCRFGQNAQFAIVDAEVLSYDKIICKSPADFNLQELYGSSVSVPIGISFEDEEFEPWTESTHRFRYYDPPKLVRADPDEIEVGKMAEVYIFADDNSEFWEPMPNGGQSSIGPYGIECKFGRFGTSVGLYVNKTTIKCVTPTVQDDPEDIWRETVQITVALNGQDFDEDNSEVDFTFVGTGSTLVFWPYVIGTLLIGLLLVALFVFCSALWQDKMSKITFQQTSSVRVRNRPYVIRDPYEQFVPRAYTQGQVGRAGPY